MPKKSFILNDETVENSHGFILLNAGGKLDRFKANPVMFYNHDDDELPIGNWDNLRVEGKQLLADPVFDESDEEAKRVSGKVERGFLKGASIGLRILKAEFIADKLYVTEWEMIEASVVNIPSNKSSLRLYSKEGVLLKSPEEIKTNLNLFINKTPDNMEKIKLSAKALTALSLDENADPEAVSAAIEKLHERAEKAETKLAADKKQAAENLVNAAIAEGKLTADKKESFVALATADFAQAQSIIGAIPAKKELSKEVKTGTGSKEDRSGWTYLKWSKEDPKGLAKMKTDDPTAFAELTAPYKS